MSRKKKAAKNLVARMKKASPKETRFDDAGSGRERITRAGAGRGDDLLVEPDILFPGNEDFFMTTDGTRFFCMQRSGAQDVVHASFFSELKCRGHMKNSHNLA